MREFVYYSENAPTKGNFGNDLMKAGRIDIATHIVIGSFFISNKTRTDVKLHLIFNGKPDPTKHLEITPSEEVHISKKDIIGLIKRMLYKYKKGEKFEAMPNCFIEKKSLKRVLDELESAGNEIYILDPKGEDIRNIEITDKMAFVIGDQEGIPKKELKTLRKKFKTLSVGKKTYFASQTLTIIQNEIDRRGH